MKCPYRKEIITSINSFGTKKVTVNFPDCYQNTCPFWSTLCNKCVRPNCKEEREG